MVCLNQRVYTWFENRAVSGYTAEEDEPRMRQWLIQEIIRNGNSALCDRYREVLDCLVCHESDIINRTVNGLAEDLGL